MSYRILLVDDNDDNVFSTRYLLERDGFRVDSAGSGAEALRVFKNRKDDFALVLMDYHMPDRQGHEVAGDLLAEKPGQMIAMYTCDGTREALKDTLDSGMVAFLEKTKEPTEFLTEIRRLCAKYEQTSKPILGNTTPDQLEQQIRATGMVGRSASTAEVARLTGLFAGQDQTVLIQGETGTGKEVVAQALHRLSTRNGQPFISLNCAAIPENLLESTLFGHERGAFTGADKSKVGKFVLANRGTIFLDEIGDMSPSLQAKLLRVLQEREVEPVGSNTVQKIDVRVIVATHRDLKAMVAAETFRQDLFYRLNVLTIPVLPLRERPEDIEPLIAHFTEIFCKRQGVQKSFQRATLPILLRYSWPGNVRELINVVEKHLIEAPGPSVRVEDLSSLLFEVDSTRRKTVDDLKRKHTQEMRRLIQEALAQTPTKADAARRIGVSPSRFHYYLETYEITT